MRSELRMDLTQFRQIFKFKTVHRLFGMMQSIRIRDLILCLATFFRSLWANTVHTAYTKFIRANILIVCLRRILALEVQIAAPPVFSRTRLVFYRDKCAAVHCSVSRFGIHCSFHGNATSFMADDNFHVDSNCKLIAFRTFRCCNGHHGYYGWP